MSSVFDKCFDYNANRAAMLENWRNWTLTGFITFTGFVYLALFSKFAPNYFEQSVKGAIDDSHLLAFTCLLLILHFIIGVMSFALIVTLGEMFADRCQRAEEIAFEWSKQVLATKAGVSPAEDFYSYTMSYPPTKSRPKTWKYKVTTIHGYIVSTLLAGDTFVLVFVFRDFFEAPLCMYLVALLVSTFVLVFVPLFIMKVCRTPKRT